MGSEAGNPSLADFVQVRAAFGRTIFRTQLSPNTPRVIPANPGSAPNLKMKILSVDDSRMVHMVVTKAFKAAGIQVIIASNGQEGLDKARSEHPDMIVLDATMPVMNGIDALEQLKLDPTTREIPVVMLTTDAAKDNDGALVGNDSTEREGMAYANEVLQGPAAHVR